MKKLKRHYFYDIEHTAKHKWSPSQISGFFLGTFIVTVLFNAYPFYLLTIQDEGSTRLTEMIGIIVPILVIFQFLCIVFYSNKERALIYQYSQAVLFPFVALTFALSPIFMYWLICDMNYLEDVFYTFGYALLIIGFFIIIVLLINYIIRIRQGDFQRHGKGVYGLDLLVSNQFVVVMFIVLIVGGAIAIHIITGSQFDMYIFPYFFFIISMAIYIPICFMIPEMILLAYFKKRFPKFNITE